MTTRVNFSHNIESVISDIDDVEDDLRHEFRKRVGAAMRVLWADARQYVLDDPHNRGNLFRSITNDTSSDSDGLEFVVYTDPKIAAHAAIVEYGSGFRSNTSYPGGNKVPPGLEDSVPLGYPFESPDIPFNRDNPIDTGGYPTFYGFAKHIEDWMREKPVTPNTGDYFASAALIAATIVTKGNYAHPFLRPAWFDNELKIKKAARNAVRNAVR